jgi:2-oxo-4-hydroxy-4-carboxy-5-ureidoimidazoline decarboxylase
VPERVTLDALNTASSSDFVAALGDVFEYSPWVAAAVATRRPFAGLADLRSAMVQAIDMASPEQRLKLICSHPDLANKTQRAAGLTSHSTSEQDGAGLDRLSEMEFTLFEKLNNAYKDKFGFPFILCVRRHTKDSILDAFARRLNNDAAREEKEALAEIHRIATLRLAKLVESQDRLPVYGSLSTHVLDTHLGLPAAGLDFALIELSRHGEDRVLLKATTNADGRTDAALVEGRPVPIGTYELRFHAGAYFATRRVALSTPPFLDVIPLRFSVSEPEKHLHVPLLLTPWSYTTYRGS